MQPPKSYLVLTVLASVVLFYVLRLSASGRGLIDWIVIAAVSTAILWNLLGLGRRLHAAGGQRLVWHEVRTLIFWVVGLRNTAWAGAKTEGSWAWWVGVAMLLVGVADTIALYWKEQRSVGRMT